MHRIHLHRRGFAGVASAVALGALVAAGPAAAAPTVSVVAKGLNTPKYMTFGPGGGLYVAESGTGGKQCVPGLGVTGVPTRFCIGDTGSVVDVTTRAPAPS